MTCIHAAPHMGSRSFLELVRPVALGSERRRLDLEWRDTRGRSSRSDRRNAVATQQRSHWGRGAPLRRRRHLLRTHRILRTSLARTRLPVHLRLGRAAAGLRCTARRRRGGFWVGHLLGCRWLSMSRKRIVGRHHHRSKVTYVTSHSGKVEPNVGKDFPWFAVHVVPCGLDYGVGCRG